VVPQYLEMSMTQFARNQDQMRRYMQNAFGFNPFQQFESMGKQNMAMFENAMRMFNPFGTGPGGQAAGGQPPAPAATAANGHEPAKPEAAAPSGDTAIDDLKRKLDELQSQLAETRQEALTGPHDVVATVRGPPRDVAVHWHLQARPEERPLSRLPAHD
jgi:polyhydroxyalkanoate synthesis regulator protein